MNTNFSISASLALIPIYWDIAMQALQWTVLATVVGAIAARPLAQVWLGGRPRLRLAMDKVALVFLKLSPWMQSYYWVLAMAALDVGSPMIAGAALTVLSDTMVRQARHWMFGANMTTSSASNCLATALDGLAELFPSVMRQYLLLMLGFCSLSSPNVSLIFGVGSNADLDAEILVQSLVFFGCVFFCFFTLGGYLIRSVRALVTTH